MQFDLDQYLTSSYQEKKRFSFIFNKILIENVQDLY